MQNERLVCLLLYSDPKRSYINLRMNPNQKRGIKMKMELVKDTEGYKILKKKNGRFGVKDKKGKWITGDKKVGILSDEGLIKIHQKKEEISSQEAKADSNKETSAEPVQEAGSETPS